jgi:uncharacterized membrane protein
MAGVGQERIERGRRQARWLGAGGFLVAAVAPVVLFGHVIRLLAAQPRLELQYATGWLPWVLLAGGLLFLLPVAWSAGLDPDSRFFPRARAAYAGWGITLYLLGLLLAWQVAAVQDAAFR